MLGQLYRPKGLALETARAVLQVEDPWACNVAAGCSNACRYPCYLHLTMRCSQEQARIVRHPKEEPADLVEKQLQKMDKKNEEIPKGVFLSFLTDPLLEENEQATESLIDLLIAWNIRVAVLSKVGVPQQMHPKLRVGMTIVSFKDYFWKTYEPNTLPPLQRADLLQKCFHPWVSMEPYPVSKIIRQYITDVLGKLQFVERIIFGKWNYDLRARGERAQQEYRTAIIRLLSFCKDHKIDCHVKSDTLKFVGWSRKTPEIPMQTTTLSEDS